jgi:hypothetical protein
MSAAHVIQPVPVIERLPGPEDCDIAKGQTFCGFCPAHHA